ncbi:MAG TPA: bifunctional phosphoribosylaminoimidazolecarboxamide formyltransferase/IMP cyclohydrolase [Rubrobacteraceae bacterium]|nr:bifunctional phosphoribosylaminoimidazolecarboxamide formyltransferase/IMP cyclohydrolase [Rubrobacteraceae bacterium]
MKRRALVSVSDKQGVAAFARRLHKLGFEILSTGGTARALEEARVPVVPVSEVTGEPEILGGRVKTLHPKIHGGILADLENPDHVTELVEHDIGPIDLVCINLYPFEETVSGGADVREAIEQIDVGGPAMLRAAAKNFRSAIVVSSPEVYNDVLTELEAEGQLSLEFRRRLALAAFRRTARYDAAIADWLEDRIASDSSEPDFASSGGDEDFPERLALRYEKALSVRYGENPHQRAAYYARAGEEHLLSGVQKLQGKDLSFNNLNDLDAARTLLAELGDRPAAVIVKHATPCGAAVGETLSEAYAKALASDPLSAFGGIVALNAVVDRELAAEISQVFTEVLVAPEYTPEATETLGRKPNMSVLRAGELEMSKLSAKDVTGGLLLQDTDVVEDGSGYRVVTKRVPTPKQMEDLEFAWRVAKRVRSNAIVLARSCGTVGIGGGQTSRVDAAELAVRKAGERARGAAAASDAFFPFADSVEALAAAGVTAVIQPGGSKRDEEVIVAANERGVAMVFTDRRHFLH